MADPVAHLARLRLVFCGTPQFAVPTLEALLAAGHVISLVVTPVSYTHLTLPTNREV